MDIKKIWGDFQKEGKTPNYDRALKRLQIEAQTTNLELSAAADDAKESLNTYLSSCCGAKGAFAQISALQAQVVATEKALDFSEAVAEDLFGD